MPIMNDPAVWFKDLFVNAGLSYSFSSFLSTIALVVIVILFSWVSNLIAKAIILKIVTRIVKKTTNTWDDIFLEQKVFTRLSHFAPSLVIWFMASWALTSYPSWLIVIHKLTYIYMVFIGMVVINSFIEAWHEIYKTLPIARHRHIKGYVQLLKIFIVFITILVIVSVVFKKDISTLIAGFGAMAAVLILVFRDTLLGLVASIQLSADKMLKIGDCISIPRRDVDGIFRFYAETYLRQHPQVDSTQTIIMRHRPFEGNGLPLQLYLFTKNNQFTPFENMQSGIFEHLLAIMNEFGLKVFQQPSGDDLQTISKK